jgi:SdpI/YfhL protein family
VRNLVTGLFLVDGLLFAAIGVPLALDKVPPNSWYGFRTPKTLSDPDIWYAINRSSGIDLMIAGAAIAGLSLALEVTLKNRSPAELALANLGAMVIALGAVAVRGFLKLSNLGS